MNCTYCGAQIAPNQSFCSECGAAVYVPVPQQAPIRTMTVNDLPPQYRPLGAWSYFGYTILFSIPVVGFIFLIIFSISGANINRRNFARSYWCILVVAAVIILILAIAGAIGVTRTVHYYR